MARQILCSKIQTFIHDILCKEFNASCIVGLFKKIEIDEDSEIDNVEREED